MYEWQQQAQFIQWVRHHHPQLTVFHIPNGEYRDIRTAKKLKLMGVLPGVYDIYVLELQLFIEVKSNRAGKLSKAQKKFRELAIRSNHQVIEGYGLHDLINKFQLALKQGQKVIKTGNVHDG